MTTLSRAKISGERRVIYYHGHVQGVGFRQATAHLARGLALTGYVRNLADGRVKLVVEGPITKLDLLQYRLGKRMKEHVDTIDVTVRKSTGGYTDFDIQQ